MTTLQSKIDAEESDLKLAFEKLQDAERDLQARQQALQLAVQEYRLRAGWLEKLRDLQKQVASGELVVGVGSEDPQAAL